MPRRERLDALILGGGMAGLSAALTLRGFGLNVVVIEEGRQPGGQLHDVHARILDYPLAYGMEGASFAAKLLDDARAAGLPILVGCPITAVSARGRWAEREDERVHARALLIALGLRRRGLGVPGEGELLGSGVSHSANRDRGLYAGRPVAVVGGGTAAVEDALLCADVGSEVTLLHRSRRFRARADFLARARKHPNIRIVAGAEVVAILGEERVEEVRFTVAGSRATRHLPVAAVFVRVGWDPRTEILRGQVALDRAGYIKTKVGGATSVPGVYAAGDICSPRCPSLANAAGQGAAAGWEIVRFLGRLPA
jgi:thioredoxin reductase (NADPH)